VNYFAHLWVAREALPTGPAEALGVVLPDVLAMAGTKADPRQLPPAVLAGRDIHHRADRAFHRHPRFLTLVEQLRGTLVGAQLPAGAAHAGAHAGNELLLDGILPDASVVGALTDGLALAPLVHPALAVADRTRFELVVERVALDRPSNLADPEAIAQRLFRVLGRRPRLAFPAEQVPALANSLAEHRPSVVAASQDLLSSVVRGLVDPGTTPTSPGYPGSMAASRTTSPGA
jgi:hypothetical protein